MNREGTSNAPIFSLSSLSLVLSLLSAQAMAAEQANFKTFDSCSEMKVEESRRIETSSLPLTIGVPYPNPGYLLKRTPDSQNGKSNYEAILNIQFSPAPGSHASSVPAMLEKVSRCYQNLPLIEDPNGRRLTLRLVNGGEDAPARNVTLTEEKLLREDMISWSTQSNCRTIVHETFHLLGLVDLYPESSLKNEAGQTLFNCRTLGSPDSVMRDLHQSHFSGTRYKMMSCSCNPVGCDRGDLKCLTKNSQCSKDLAALTQVPNACPVTTDSGFYFLSPDAYDMATSSVSQAFFNANYAGTLQNGNHPDKYRYSFIKLEADPTSFLYPAELRMILSPGCAEKNSVYYQCAKGAYVTTSPTLQCPVTPAICGDPKAWLQ